MTTIVLADDHQVVRQGLRALLEAEPAYVVVGEAADGLEAVDLVERVKPDVLIIDVMLPGLNGLDATRQVRQRCPTTRVIVLSMHANEGFVMEALRNGAAGYVVKDSSITELTRAIGEVMLGRHYLSPPLGERAIETYMEKAAHMLDNVYDSLTMREREVLQLVVQGHTNAEIAARLCISARTVETHRAHVMHKLGLHTHTDLIRYAIRRGMLPLDD